MEYLGIKTLIIILAIFFAIILCGAVSATSIINTSSNTTLSKNTDKNLVSSSVYPKKIDSDVTSCYWFKGSKYYWTTYLYNDKIVIYSHFYNPKLKHQIYQKTIIAPYFYNGKRSGMYFFTTPKY
jgi:hypothetical protein